MPRESRYEEDSALARQGWYQHPSPYKNREMAPFAELMDLPYELLATILSAYYQDALSTIDRITGLVGFGSGTDICGLALLNSRLLAVIQPMLYERVVLADKLRYEQYASTLEGFEDKQLACLSGHFNPFSHLKRLELIGMGKHMDDSYKTIFRLIGGHLQQSIYLKIDYGAMLWWERSITHHLTLEEQNPTGEKEYSDLKIHELDIDYKDSTSGEQPGHALRHVDWICLMEICSRIQPLRKVRLSYCQLAGEPAQSARKLAKCLHVRELVIDRTWWTPGVSRTVAFAMPQITRIGFDGIGNKEHAMFDVLGGQYQAPRPDGKQRKLVDYGFGRNLFSLSILWSREIWNGYVHLKSNLITTALLSCPNLVHVALDQVTSWEEDRDHSRRPADSPICVIPKSIRTVELRKCSKKTIKDLLRQCKFWPDLRELKIDMVEEQASEQDKTTEGLSNQPTGSRVSKNNPTLVSASDWEPGSVFSFNCNTLALALVAKGATIWIHQWYGSEDWPHLSIAEEGRHQRDLEKFGYIKVEPANDYDMPGYRRL